MSNFIYMVIHCFGFQFQNIKPRNISTRALLRERDKHTHALDPCQNRVLQSAACCSDIVDNLVRLRNAIAVWDADIVRSIVRDQSLRRKSPARSKDKPRRKRISESHHILISTSKSNCISPYIAVAKINNRAH